MIINSILRPGAERSARRPRAFTLVEVLITVAILACGIIPLLTMLSEQHRGTADIVNKVIAANYAKDVVDYLKSLPYSDVDSKYNGVEIGGKEESEFFAKLPKLVAPFTRKVEIIERRDRPLSPATPEKIDYKIIKVTMTFDKNDFRPVNGITLFGTLMMDKIKKQQP